MGYKIEKGMAKRKKNRVEVTMDNDQIVLTWHNELGQIHRDNDLPVKIYSDGSKYWYKNGLQHRDGDKPAVIDTFLVNCGIKMVYNIEQEINLL